jgi:biopolymer transport protein ExbD
MRLYTQHLSPLAVAPDAEAAPLVEMNTTPLIDVLLVLIVMLIITIPVPLHSVNLDMPSTQVSSAVPEVVVLQIDAKGFVVWGGDKLPSMADVNARIAAAAAQPVQPEIHLQPAPDTPYAFVAGVLVMAKKAGLQKVGVVN